MRCFNILLGILLLASFFFASCNEEKTTIPDSEHLNVDRDKVMKYVQCPQDTVDYLLQVADSIYKQRDKYVSLEMIDFCDEERNHWLDSLHGDTIPLVTSLYAFYDAVTTSVSDNIIDLCIWIGFLLLPSSFRPLYGN